MSHTFIILFIFLNFSFDNMNFSKSSTFRLCRSFLIWPPKPKLIKLKTTNADWSAPNSNLSNFLPPNLTRQSPKNSWYLHYFHSSFNIVVIKFLIKIFIFITIKSFVTNFILKYFYNIFFWYDTLYLQLEKGFIRYSTTGNLFIHCVQKSYIFVKKTFSRAKI